MKRTEAKHVEDFKRTATTEHARTIRDYITRLERELVEAERGRDQACKNVDKMAERVMEGVRLFRVYVSHVEDCEGVSFLGSAWSPGGPVSTSEEDFAKMRLLALGEDES